MEKNVAVFSFALNDDNEEKYSLDVFCLCINNSLFHRPPNLPPKPHWRPRPRSVFNIKLFNGNLEAFIKVQNVTDMRKHVQATI